MGSKWIAGEGEVGKQSMRPAFAGHWIQLNIVSQSVCLQLSYETIILEILIW